MGPVPDIVAKQAELRKLDGNTFFKKDRLGAAIDAYTEAITLCPNVAVYWTNRALCFKKRNEWSKVEDDCRTALKLDHNSVKAHYMLGLALLDRQEFAEGIKQLEKSLELGRGAHPASYMVEEIWQELAKAKFSDWERSSFTRSDNLRILQEACENSLRKYHGLDGSDEILIEEQIKELKNVFAKAALADQPTDVPDHLCCKITLDIFRDPVITPSGVSYERAVILEHLHKVGKFDPVTREPLEPYQLVPNLAIKEAVQSFLTEHGWAYKMR
ncbi:hypothetical protein LUZ60_015906 [Juncus effusus]|nr:hypothetical protein LUZ60_015906 [Juncus effusus]